MTTQSLESAPARIGSTGESLHGDGLGHNGLLRRAEQTPAAVLRKTLGLAISRALEPALVDMVDRVFHEGISRVVEATPDAVSLDEEERQLEQLLHAVVEEILDGILVGPVGIELEVHGRHAIAAAVHRDGDKAQSEGSAALAAVAEEVSRVLQDHRQDLIGLATRALARATGAVAEEKVPAAIQTPKAGQEQGGGDEDVPVAEQHHSVAGDRASKSDERSSRDDENDKHEESRTNDTGQEIRDQLTDAGRTLMRQLSTETEKLQQRLKQEMGSAVKDGTQNQKLGRAPTGGHPSAGLGVPRGPSQGAPGTCRRKGAESTKD